jgi:uncharacterized membrane protein YjgN (DUF898 family)
MNINKSEAKLALAYVPPVTLLFYALVVMFAPLNFSRGLEFVFGVTEARGSFTSSLWTIFISILLIDLVRARRHTALMAGGVVTLALSIPHLLAGGGSFPHYGRLAFVFTICLLGMSFIVYKENDSQRSAGSDN